MGWLTWLGDKLLALGGRFSENSELVRLREKVRQLEDRRGLAATLEFRDDAYWQDGKGPFCPKCWHTSTTAELTPMQLNVMRVPHCAVCGTTARPANTREPEPVEPYKPPSTWS